MPALAAFGRDPNALLVALRQLISRQPESPGLLALGATMLHALDPVQAGYDFVDRLHVDPTAELAELIASAEAGGTDVIDSIASGPGQVVCPAGTDAWIDSARAAGRSVVVVTPLGSRLPNHLWEGYLGRNGWDRPVEPDEPAVIPVVLPLETFDDLIDGEGVRPLDSWSPDCPAAIEIARH